MVSIDENLIRDVQEKILSFYDDRGRDLPWRETHDPYNVWVSEIMLQQTQVSRVIPKYEAWSESFPTVHDLAEASFKTVLEHWSGLGYNNRAKWIHSASRTIRDEHSGRVPRDDETLQSLQGIGPYTARAIRIFAYSHDVVTVDTNIRRVLISELDLSEDLEEDDLYTVAEQLLPVGESRRWHNALMDYGALVATSTETGISPTTTQSDFDGSIRQVRGEILRRLQDQDTIQPGALIDEYPERGEAAIAGLVEDGLIEEDGGLKLV